MKIYIAASFKNREKMRPMRDKLWSLGHQITSTWIDEVAKPRPMSDMEFKRKLAMKDLCEVAAADLVILDCELSSGGKNTEAGFALGQFHNKLYWTVGEHTNIFQSLADMYFPNWEGLFDYLAAKHPGETKKDAMTGAKVDAVY